MGGDIVIFNEVVSAGSNVISIPYDDTVVAKDPHEVYMETRPAEWVQLPTPNEDEMYMLMLIPEGCSSLLSFKVTCSGDYTVDIGYIYEDSFNVNESTNVSSGSIFETSLSAYDFYGPTYDGMVQAIIKVSGSGITQFARMPHSQYDSTADTTNSWNVVDMIAKLPSVTDIGINSWKTLRYFSLLGTNNITDGGSLFYECYSLIAVTSFDASKCSSFSAMFYNCHNLLAIPAMDTSSRSLFGQMFAGCYSLEAIPFIDTSDGYDFSGMFKMCRSLKAVPYLYFPNVVYADSMFKGCSSLKRFPSENQDGLPMIAHRLTSATEMFSGCSSLEAIPDIEMPDLVEANYMFYGCTSLLSTGTVELDSCVVADYMFGGCTGLISAGPLYFNILDSASGMFYGCNTISKIIIASAPEMSWNGCDLTIPNSPSPAAMSEFIRNLPTIGDTHYIYYQQDDGYIVQPSDADLELLSAKNWELQLPSAQQSEG